MDESGTPPRREKVEDQYLVIAGPVIRLSQWKGIKRDFEATKTRHGVTGEIKWKDFGTHRASHRNALNGLTHGEKDALRTELLQLVASCPLIACVVDVRASYDIQNVETPEDVYRLAYRGAVHLFHEHLSIEATRKDRARKGVIISDHRMRKDDDLLHRHHEDLLSGASGFLYPHFVETLMFSRSHFSLGLQLADLVAGSIYRAYQNNDTRFAEALSSGFCTRPPIGRLGAFHAPACWFYF